jgi:D-glycero-alpha-D-manno-heptose-7-phosphate kinase
MIVTRTPLRVSFVGGGTDLPEFYEKYSGAVLSTAIDKYTYVTVKRHGKLFNESYRLNYSDTEHVARLEEMKNDIGRECLKMLNVEPPIYISTVADLPAFSGLGSSSSFAVGLLNALHALENERVSAGQLAEEAAHIEIEILKRPIGKQDQYAAAFGGLNYIVFQPDGRVSLEPQNLPNGELDKLFKSILMFWTGMVRDSSSVLTEQKRNINNTVDYLEAMRDQASQLRQLIQNGFDLEVFAEALNESWHLKRKLASGVTNEQIDAWWERAVKAGALGGKLCGAGGGGFLLFIVKPENQNAVRQALSDLPPIQIGYESQGSRVLDIE